MDEVDDFDPESVPRFPVFRLSVESDGTATFDGEPISVPEGMDPIDAAVEAAADKAQRLGLGAVRTIGSYHGEPHEFVITAEGERYDTTLTPENTTSPNHRRRNLRALGLIAGALVVVIALVVTVVGLVARRQPAPQADPGPPGAGEQVPVKLPAGYATRATWSVPVADNAGVEILAGGDVLTTADDQLEARDPNSGALTWAGSDAPQSTSDVHETTWAGKPVLAAVNGQNITLWPRYIDARPTEPVTIDAGAQATVTYAGDTPLIDLGDYTVGIPGDGDQLGRLTIPTGSKPVINAKGNVTSLGDNVITDTDVKTGRQSKPRALHLPDKLSGPPQTAYGIDPTHAIGFWAQHNSTRAVLIDTAKGTSLASTIQQGTSGTETIALDKATHTALLGNLFATTSGKPGLATIESNGDATLSGGTVFVSDTQAAAAWTWTDGKATRTNWPRYNDDDPLPQGKTRDALYLVAHQVDHDQLYRIGVDHTPTATHEPSTPKAVPKGKALKPTLDKGHKTKTSKKQKNKGDKK